MRRPGQGRGHAQRYSEARSIPISTEVEISVTRHQGVALLVLTPGRQVGLFGGAGVGKTLLIQELINNARPRATVVSSVFAGSLSTRKATTSITNSRILRSQRRAGRLQMVSCPYGQMN